MTTDAYSPEQASVLSRPLARSDRPLLILLAVTVLFVSFYNLEMFPRTWLDEGWHLQMPKNLVLYGKYATLSFEGSPIFTPTFAREMPTVFFPIALVFKLFGVGLFQARLVMALYLVLAVLAVYLVTSHVYDRKTAILAGFLFILATYSQDPSASPLFLGRQVMGEVPAFFFFLIGCLLWFKAFDSACLPLLSFSGLCFGLAILTKSWFAFLIWPTMAVVWLADVVYYQRLGFRHFAVPFLLSVISILAWVALLYFILGPEDFATHSAIVRSASSTSAALFSMRRALSGIKFLISSDFLIWGLSGLIYAAVLALDKQKRALTAFHLLAFTTVSLTWYVFVSIAWGRYAFPVFAVANVFVAKLIRDLSGGFDLGKLRAAVNQRNGLDLVRQLGVTLVLVFFVISSFARTIEQITTADDDAPQRFADYIDTHLNQNVLIETVEWEISFLTRHSLYHHPPPTVMDALTMHAYLDAPYSSDLYDFQKYDPDYVVVGIIAKWWTELYPPDFLAQECTLVKSIGDYDLYRVNVREEK